MKKYKKLIIILTIIISIVIGIGFVGSKWFDKKNEEIKKEELQSNYDFKFKDYVVKENAVNTEIRANGVIDSFSIEKIQIPEQARITKKYVESGVIVQNKQVLFTILDNEEYKNIYAGSTGLYIENMEDQNKITYNIYNTDNMGVMLSINEFNVAKLVIGQTATIYVAPLDKNIEGTIQNISSIAKEGKFSVKVKIPYSEDLKFGYSANALINVNQKSGVISIPSECLMFDINTNKTYIVLANNKKEINKLKDKYNIPEKYRTYVTTGASDSNFIEILEGLKIQDVILQPDYGMGS